MLDSQSKSAAQVGEAQNSEQAVNFRFSITWSTLLASSSTAKDSHAAKAMFALAPAVEPQSSNRKAVAVSDVKWEVVAPKLVRQPFTQSVESPPETLSPSQQSFPDLTSGPLFQTRNRGAWKPLVGAALLVALSTAIVVPIWRHATPARSKAKSLEVETDTRGGGWIRESATNGDSGAKEARQLVLYRPSLNAANGQLEFTWTVAEPGVGWIFRAKDVGNYYAMRLRVLSRAPSFKLSVERFTVHLGNEGAHSEKVLELPRNESALRIRMDISGPTFTLYLQGNAVEYWTDTRLTAGGFGFYEERNQAAEVRSVRMSFPQSSQARLEPPSVRRIDAALARNRFYIWAAKPTLASGGA